MRARNIKPGFFKNADLAELSFEVRILFQGLWCLADRKGRLADRPKQIKGEIFPYDESLNIDNMLTMLQKHGFILRYGKDGKRYIQVISFEKHQYPHIKEQDSTIPAPCKTRAKTMLARLNPESPILNPESITEYRKLDLAGVFESLWLDYPKRLGRKGALGHFNASVKTEADVTLIRVALAKYKKHVVGKERKYIQHGSTWFNNWRDWINFEEESNATHDGPSPVSYSAIARAKRQAESLRTHPTAGEIHAGVRDLPDVQDEASPGE